MNALRLGALAAALLLAGVLPAQDAGTPAAATDAAAPGESAEPAQPDSDPAADTAADDEAAADGAGQDTDEVLETDDESYLDIDQEDFKPSEEIPSDQSVSFPTDI